MTAATLTWDEGDDGALTVAYAGDWLLVGDLPGYDEVVERLAEDPAPPRLRFMSDSLGDWDSGLLTHLIAVLRSAEAHGVSVDTSGLPEGTRRLLDLAFAVKEREGARSAARDKGFFEEVGDATLAVAAELKALLTFSGELALSLGRFARGKATYQRADIALYCQEAGAESLPIVSLISVLIGMIFAFVGVMQLETLGAGIYTANLVAIAMIREMAPIMTAIIMAGRMGASYAAQIGSMKVNEEIDALSTLGIQPIDFLVTPRVFALVVMMPLLTIYAGILGVAGGTIVGVVMLDVSFVQFVHQAINAVGFNSLFGGLFKSVVYGALVAMSGCQQGMACGGSAMAVGQATTRAVVLGIVLIVVSAAILTVVYINLGI